MFNENLEGIIPIKINIINPIPFCPSLDPCEKLTPAEDKINIALTKNGGFFFPSCFSLSIGVK